MKPEVTVAVLVALRYIVDISNELEMQAEQLRSDADILKLRADTLREEAASAAAALGLEI